MHCVPLYLVHSLYPSNTVKSQHTKVKIFREKKLRSALIQCCVADVQFKIHSIVNCVYNTSTCADTHRYATVPVVQSEFKHFFKFNVPQFYFHNPEMVLWIDVHTHTHKQKRTHSIHTIYTYIYLSVRIRLTAAQKNRQNGCLLFLAFGTMPRR